MPSSLTRSKPVSEPCCRETITPNSTSKGTLELHDGDTTIEQAVNIRSTNLTTRILFKMHLLPHLFDNFHRASEVARGVLFFPSWEDRPSSKTNRRIRPFAFDQRLRRTCGTVISILGSRSVRELIPGGHSPVPLGVVFLVGWHPISCPIRSIRCPLDKQCSLPRTPLVALESSPAAGGCMQHELLFRPQSQNRPCPPSQ